MRTLKESGKMGDGRKSSDLSGTLSIPSAQPSTDSAHPQTDTEGHEAASDQASDKPLRLEQNCYDSKGSIEPSLCGYETQRKINVADPSLLLASSKSKRIDNSSVFQFAPSEIENASREECARPAFNDDRRNAEPGKPESVAVRPDCLANGYSDVDVTAACHTKPCPFKSSESATKFQHISFDCPQSKKECELRPCPSLDSSLSSPNKALSKNTPRLVSSSPFLDPTLFQSASPSLPPLTPSSPASVVASQASLDSGVLSAHSFDLSQNVGLEVFDKRRRTASSVSSGIGEVWQSSLDGEPPTMEVVCETLKAGKSRVPSEEPLSVPVSAPDPEARNECPDRSLDLNVKVGNPSGEEGCLNTFPSDTKLVGAHSPAHNQVDHSYVLPETCLEPRDVSLSVIFPVAAEESPIPAAINSETNDTSLVTKSQVLTKKPEKMMLRSISSCRKGNLQPDFKCSSEAQKKIEKFALNLVMLVLNEALSQSVSLGWSIKCSGQCNQELCREDYRKKSSTREGREKEGEKSLFSSLGLSSCSSSLCWTPELPFSPSHRSISRASKRSSLSFSHDSLVGGPSCPDDSHLIKGAISHDALVFPTTQRKLKERKGTCAVCLDADIYSLPVDVVKPYQGPILHPKVIMQQPKKRYLNRNSIKITKEGEPVGGISSKRNSAINKKKVGKHNSQRVKNSVPAVVPEVAAAATSRRKSSQSNAEGLQLSESVKSVDKNNLDSSAAEVERERPTERCKSRHRKELKCPDQGKLCRIIPFTSNKPYKRKDLSEAKVDRKKGRSLSSNIRNTLVTFFSFKKTQKEHGNCINAKNEFIDASSQGFYESSDGLKWGKICPLPSAPPLRSSMKYSAFSDHVSATAAAAASVSSAKPAASHNRKEPAAAAPDPKATSANLPSSNSSSSSANATHQRQSISPASLLSCLGHPRTNSIDEQERRPPRSRLPSEAPKQPSLPAANKATATVSKRALPPLPAALRVAECPEDDDDDQFGHDWKPHTHHKLDEGCDFASIIEKVKNYGWYWGPISGEAAEKVLSNEPDGSFIVRDSSDYHYIFSLTFRLNGVTRHVRIEHDQGNFSFGGFTRFKSQTIVDFIEKAVEHSRSGRYLFFLHRRPVLGPMRVQLLHPVSRFKHVQSLQHLCRFIIVKQVRKDLIHDLPLPQRLKDYLSSPHYYSEQVEQCMSSSSALSLEGAVASPETRRNRSPCLRHASQSRIQARFRTDSSLLQPHGSGLNRFSNPNSAQETSESVFAMSLRCNLNDPSTSVGPSRLNKSRELRLSSSHSSLENSLLQAYPVSPSTLSSGSNSAKPKFSLRKKTSPFFSGSSHSSPSSPVPFDYSPPDLLSSSEDLFPVQMSSVKVPPTAHLLRDAVGRRDIQSDDNFFRLSLPAELLKAKTASLPASEESACLASHSVTEAFDLCRSRRVCDTKPVDSASATPVTETSCGFLQCESSLGSESDLNHSGSSAAKEEDQPINDDPLLNRAKIFMH